MDGKIQRWKSLSNVLLAMTIAKPTHAGLLKWENLIACYFRMITV